MFRSQKPQRPEHAGPRPTCQNAGPGRVNCKHETCYILRYIYEENVNYWRGRKIYLYRNDLIDFVLVNQNL